MGARLSVMPWGTLRAPARTTQAARSSRQTAGGLHRRAVPLSHEALRLILSPPSTAPKQPPGAPLERGCQGGLLSPPHYIMSAVSPHLKRGAPAGQGQM